ncbi:hypothetical protein I3760_08G131900 [Carya illinoinensis]|nr:hypothetical protein I3760_08G131900 [Carya illinoinensis]
MLGTWNENGIKHLSKNPISYLLILEALSLEESIAISLSVSTFPSILLQQCYTHTHSLSLCVMVLPYRPHSMSLFHHSNKSCRSVLHSSLHLRSTLPHNRAAAKQGIPIWFFRDKALSRKPPLSISLTLPLLSLGFVPVRMKTSFFLLGSRNKTSSLLAGFTRVSLFSNIVMYF